MLLTLRMKLYPCFQYIVRAYTCMGYAVVQFTKGKHFARCHSASEKKYVGEKDDIN
jgi:hypothetical protein